MCVHLKCVHSENISKQFLNIVADRNKNTGNIYVAQKLHRILLSNSNIGSNLRFFASYTHKEHRVAKMLNGKTL